MLKAEINQTRLKGGQRIPRAIVTKLLREVSRALKLRGDYHISLAFVSPNEIRKLNKIYRGKDQVTDVLSFRLATPIFGEVLICYSQAKRQAKEQKHSTRKEIIFLFVHGILHLFGHDHEQKKDAVKMFRLQKQIIEGIK